MAKFYPDLDRAFAALADATRRAMIARLARGPATVSELAADAGITLPSCLAHIAKLDAAGLTESEKTGRIRTCRLRPGALRPVRHWLADQQALWSTRLDQFDAYATRLAKETDHDPRP